MKLAANVLGAVTQCTGNRGLTQRGFQIDLDQFEGAGNSYGYRLKPLTDLHLRSNLRFNIEPPGNPLYVYMFLVAAILILVIAGINFMNLATAQSSGRSQEVGLRKVVGSSKPELIAQFLTESVVLSLLALVVAVILVNVLMPGYNNLIYSDLGEQAFIVKARVRLLRDTGAALSPFSAFLIFSLVI